MCIDDSMTFECHFDEGSSSKIVFPGPYKEPFLELSLLHVGGNTPSFHSQPFYLPHPSHTISARLNMFHYYVPAPHFENPGSAPEVSYIVSQIHALSSWKCWTQLHNSGLDSLSQLIPPPHNMVINQTNCKDPTTKVPAYWKLDIFGAYHRNLSGS